MPTLNRLTPPGSQFTLVTLRVLDEAPDGPVLVDWYRRHLHQLVVVNLLEGTPDFCFTAAPPTDDEALAIVTTLASTEHSIDLSGRTPATSETLTEPYGAGSRIVSSGYDLGDGRWLSALVGTLDWRSVIG